MGPAIRSSIYRRAEQHFAFDVSWSGLTPGPVHRKWFSGRTLDCTVLCGDSGEEDWQARETLPPEEEAIGRISFYFLVLTVVPSVKKAPTRKPPVWPRPHRRQGSAPRSSEPVTYDEQRYTRLGRGQACSRNTPGVRPEAFAR